MVRYSSLDEALASCHYIKQNLLPVSSLNNLHTHRFVCVAHFQRYFPLLSRGSIALPLWDALKDSITAYTGLSPATFFTVVALALAFYYLVSGLFGSSNHEISEEELKEYDGSDPNKPLLMAIKGQIYDVSQSRMFYGPGGPYALFAGKDASRALAKLSFEEKDLTGDISGLGAFELDVLRD
ncbi:Membrane steroid-binding protein 1 [Capsicum annuum]|nr:Membrane steroid-binding protein 1 [Capsicum annuum]